jgi:cytochrome P450
MTTRKLIIWARFQAWSNQYGSIFSLKVFNDTMIVIADRKAAYQLLEKKGSIYSDRPFLAVPNFVTSGHHITFEQSTPSWREKRSIITRYLSPKSLDEKHFKVQEAEYVIYGTRAL